MTTPEQIREEWKKTNHGKALAEYFVQEQNEWLEDWWLAKLDEAVKEERERILKIMKEHGIIELIKG
jgi:hypothetical protein